MKLWIPALLALTMLCAGCGSGDTGADPTTAEQCPVGPGCGGNTGGGDSIPTGGSGGGSTGKTTGGTSGGGGTGGSTISNGSSKAALLAAKMGRANRLMVGLGSADSVDLQSRGIAPDIYEVYLSDNPGWSWVDYNSPPGEFINIRTAEADSIGAVPMFTIYQMAVNGENNMATLKNRSLMQTYWAHVVLAFQHFGAYGKPTLVNFEPDFWGFTEQQAPGGDPTRIFAYVNITPECASLPNNVAGVAACLIAIARTYAPLSYVGFPPSAWAGTDAGVVAYMNAVGAANGDFVVQQVLDRDAGCYEVGPTVCDRGSFATDEYWDESNTTHPNFLDHFAQTRTWAQGIGDLPVVWWQIPLGVPSATPGGTPGHFRDNRVHYFLSHPDQMAAVNGLGVVFSSATSSQTDLTTDGGQFKALLDAYLAHPASLP